MTDIEHGGLAPLRQFTAAAGIDKKGSSADVRLFWRGVAVLVVPEPVDGVLLVYSMAR